MTLPMPRYIIRERVVERPTEPKWVMFDQHERKEICIFTRLEQAVSVVERMNLKFR